MVDLKEKEDIIEIQCQECKAEFEMKYLETETGEPEYCPFCGSEIDDFEMDELEELDNEEW